MNSNESSSGSDEEEEVSFEQIEIAEQTLVNNPYELKNHIQFIDLLRKSGNIEKLKKAKENIAKYFTLNDKIWIKYIQEEENISTTKEEFENVLKLYERALHDFQSIQLWTNYLNFIIEHENKIKERFKEAFKIIGIHFQKGNEIFELYRGIKNLNEEDIRESYKIQLSNPHQTIEKTFNDYANFEKNEKEVKKIKEDIYLNCLNLTKERLKFEKSLKKIESWFEYIEFENNEERKISLFERCLIKNTKNNLVWLKYIELLQENEKYNDLLMKTLTRAIKNVTNSNIIVLYMNHLQLNSKNELKNEMKLIYKRTFNLKFNSFQDYLNIFISYLTFLKNNLKQEFILELKQEFENTIGFMNKNFPDSDRTYSLVRFYAFILTTKCNELSIAKELYFSLVQNKPNDSSLWFYFIQFSMLYDFQSIREIYNQAIYLISSYYPLKSIGSNWIEFERNYGDLSSLLYVEKLYYSKLKTLEENKNEEKKVEKKEEKIEKRKREVTNNDDEMNKSKKLKLDGPGNESLTLFILNIAYTMTDDQLKQLFEGNNCNVNSVRIIKGQRGMPKGYGYIEMNDIESVEMGLKLNKKEVQGRVLKVELSNKPLNDGKKQENQKIKEKSSVGERKKKKSLFGTSAISKDEKLNETKEPLSNADFKKFLQ
eukprot:gene1888-1029_t